MHFLGLNFLQKYFYLIHISVITLVIDTSNFCFQLYIASRPVSKSKFIIQILCILWILSCTVTRIFDHRHHWWDVLSGIVYGYGLSVVTLSEYFTPRPPITINVFSPISRVTSKINTLCCHI